MRGVASPFTQKYFYWEKKADKEVKKYHLGGKVPKPQFSVMTQTFLLTYLSKTVDGDSSHDSVLLTFFHLYFHHFHSNMTSRVWFRVYFTTESLMFPTTHLTNVLQQYPYGQLSNCPHHPIQAQSHLAYPKLLLLCYLINKQTKRFLILH